MEQEEDEIKRNINNITCDTSFRSPVNMHVEQKDSKFSLQRRRATGVLIEMVECLIGCTIQSNKQVDEIFYSEEHVDASNWLRNNSAEQVDAISDSKKLVVDGSDPKSDQRVATHNTNGISATHTTQKLFINPTIQVVVRPITRSTPPMWWAREVFLAYARKFFYRRTSRTRRAVARVFTGLLGR